MRGDLTCHTRHFSLTDTQTSILLPSVVTHSLRLWHPCTAPHMSLIQVAVPLNGRLLSCLLNQQGFLMSGLSVAQSLRLLAVDSHAAFAFDLLLF